MQASECRGGSVDSLVGLLGWVENAMGSMGRTLGIVNVTIKYPELLACPCSFYLANPQKAYSEIMAARNYVQAVHIGSPAVQWVPSNTVRTQQFWGVLSVLQRLYQGNELDRFFENTPLHSPTFAGYTSLALTRGANTENRQFSVPRITINRGEVVFVETKELVLLCAK